MKELVEGSRVKGGQNPIPTEEELRNRPPAPKGSGGMSPLQVYPIGAEVILGGDKAKITAICIRGTGVTYECVWWGGADRKSAWIEECEIRACDSKSFVGFGRTS